MPRPRRPVYFPHLFGRMAIAVMLVLLMLGYGYAARGNSSPIERLVSTLEAERYTTGRLTGQRAWQACVPLDTTLIVPRVRCGPRLELGSRRVRRIEKAARQARSAARPATSTIQLRADALLELRFADTTLAASNRAVEHLEHALRLTPGDAGILNELAVAWLAIGEHTQELGPMVRALDAVERAFAADSLRPEILFNRALIQQRLYLIASAARSWSRYLAVERDPDWRAEAQAHARLVAQVPSTVSWDSLLTLPPLQMDSATRAAIAARVRRSPQAARDSSFVLLGAWGRAVLSDSAALAARLLTVARAIAAAEEAMDADRSIAHAVQAIDAAGAEPARREELARGHAALAESYRLFYQAAHERADEAFQRAERTLRAAPSPAGRWAAFYRAANEISLGRYDSAEARCRRVFAETPADEPALAGRTIWGRGVSQVRQGKYDAAIRLYREAEPYSIRAKEGENQAAIAYLLAESLGLAGQSHASAAQGLRGLRLLSPYRRSNFLNNHLTTVATFARGEGLTYGALAIMGEVLGVAQSLGKPDVVARAYRARARDLMALHRQDAALRDLTAALRWAARLGVGNAGADRVRADVILVLGQLLRPQNPHAALALLSDVAETYKELRIHLHVPVALYEAGLAAEAARDPAGARPRIQEAIEYIEQQQASLETMESRALFHETIENVFDVMIRLELAAGHPDSAFAYLERARAAIQPLPGRPAPVGRQPGHPELARMGAALSRDALFVDYALLDSQLVVWSASRDGWHHHATHVARDSVAALVERFRREAGKADPRASAARAQLYDLLLQPLRQEMEGVRRMIIVPDRELYQVPFAALWDRRTSRYLVETVEVTTVPSAAFYQAAAARPVSQERSMSALVVGNPSLHRDLLPQLPGLPGAVREAEQVAAMYDRPLLLTGGQAGRNSVRGLLPAYSIFHFAGHAVFNGEQPGLSYLALSPDDPKEDGTLRAWEIGELRLSNVKVVVLSACSTLSPRSSRAGAVTGLAYSFLRAGAPATVSTLWDMRDDATTPLLVAFHRRFAAGATVAQALRQAQLQALRSGDPEQRAPLTWGAFIYTGP
jgi:CHAT domain-containing protein